jgi:hypothetical protein
MTACDVMFLAYASCFYQALALNQTSSPHFSSRPMPRGPPFEDVVCHHDAVTVAHLWCLGQAEAKDSARQADQWRESQERVFPRLDLVPAIIIRLSPSPLQVSQQKTRSRT